LADTLKKKFGADSELLESSGGIFEVEKDGSLIFSKKQLGRFPEPGEIEKLASKK
jgi:selenoprotein W-related protein